MTKKIQKTPLPSYLKVKSANNQSGSTIFASKNIPKGKIVCTTDMTNLNYQEGCIMSPMGDVFLHSDKYANAEINVNVITSDDGKKQFKINIVTTKEIESGEEILVCYPNLRNQHLSRNELIKILRSKGESIPGTKYE